MNPHRPTQLLALAGLAITTLSARAETPATTPPPTATPPLVVTAPPPITPTDDVKSLVNRYSAQRDELLASRQAVIDRLKAASSDEERRAILESARAAERTRLDSMRHRFRNLRNDLKAQIPPPRNTPKPPGS